MPNPASVYNGRLHQTCPDGGPVFGDTPQYRLCSRTVNEEEAFIPPTKKRDVQNKPLDVRQPPPRYTEHDPYEERRPREEWHSHQQYRRSREEEEERRRPSPHNRHSREEERRRRRSPRRHERRDDREEPFINHLERVRRQMGCDRHSVVHDRETETTTHHHEAMTRRVVDDYGGSRPVYQPRTEVHRRQRSPSLRTITDRYRSMAPGRPCDDSPPRRWTWTEDAASMQRDEPRFMGRRVDEEPMEKYRERKRPREDDGPPPYQHPRHATKRIMDNQRSTLEKKQRIWYTYVAGQRKSDAATSMAIMDQNHVTKDSATQYEDVPTCADEASMDCCVLSPPSSQIESP